jgi:hypothetical protein
MTASAGGRRSPRLWLVPLLLVVLGATPLAAQITSGTVVGCVRDSAGGVIPGATVTLVSATKGTTIDTTTENGAFTFPNGPGDGGYDHLPGPISSIA